MSNNKHSASGAETGEGEGPSPSQTLPDFKEAKMENFYLINEGVYDRVKKHLARVAATPKVRPHLGLSGDQAKKLLEDFMSVKLVSMPTKKDETDRSGPVR